MSEVQQMGEENTLAQNFTVFSLLRFAAPTIFMMVFMGLYTIIDTMFVSRFVGTNALSAINIVTPVLNIIVGLSSMLATGGSAVVARKMGSEKNKEACENFTLIVLAGLAIGFLVGLAGLVFLEPIIRGLGASDLLVPYCRDYLTILLIFAPANILQGLFSIFFVTAGKPKLGLLLGLATGFVNALFDFVFIVLFQMGIRGAAIATSMGYMVPAIAGIVFFVKNRQGALYFCRPRAQGRVLLESCFNGSSEMVSQLSTAVTTFLFNRAMMRLLGEDGVAAITIIIYSQFLLTTLYIGFSLGVAPVISYNYGSRNTVQLKRIFKICFGFITGVSIAIFLLTMMGGPALIGIFSPKGTPVYEIARVGFIIFPFSFLFCGINIFTSALFTALSNGKASAFLSFMRTFGLIAPGLLILPAFFNVVGIWLAVPAAELITVFLSIFLLLHYRKKSGITK